MSALHESCIVDSFRIIMNHILEQLQSNRIFKILLISMHIEIYILEMEVRVNHKSIFKISNKIT